MLADILTVQVSLHQDGVCRTKIQHVHTRAYTHAYTHSKAFNRDQLFIRNQGNNFHMYIDIIL